MIFMLAAIVLAVPQLPAVLVLIVLTIIRLMSSIGLEPTLILLGSLNVRASTKRQSFRTLSLHVTIEYFT